MNRQRIGILIIAIIGMLATFLPWVTATSTIDLTLLGTKSFTKTISTNLYGAITFIMFSISLVISLLGDRTKALNQNQFYAVISPSIIAGIIGVWKIISTTPNDALKTTGFSVSIGIGLYLVVFAGLLLPIITLLLKNKEGDLK